MTTAIPSFTAGRLERPDGAVIHYEVGGEVLVPGEAEMRSKAKKLADGVPLSDGTWDAIAETARELGIGDNVIKAALR